MKLYAFLALSVSYLLQTLVLTQTSSATPLTNGDFSNGLNSWSATSGISATPTEEALLQDASFPEQLFQGFEISGLPFTIEFDYLSGLAYEDFGGQPFAFQDTVFSTIYFVNDLGSFDINNVGSAEFVQVADFDYSGFLGGDGLDSASNAKQGWQHITLNVNPSLSLIGQYQYAVLAFELLDLNLNVGDSNFSIDNVTHSEAVPEPATAALLAAGALLGGSQKFGRHRRFGLKSGNFRSGNNPGLN